ncbi:MAG: hypothetical protein U5K00_10245 [Melioribacteraceae bacterium]|nr:hypothetical protein [Melioribacteraceae bacterium]
MKLEEQQRGLFRFWFWQAAGLCSFDLQKRNKVAETPSNVFVPTYKLLARTAFQIRLRKIRDATVNFTDVTDN